MAPRQAPPHPGGKSLTPPQPPSMPGQRPGSPSDRPTRPDEAPQPPSDTAPPAGETPPTDQGLGDELFNDSLGSGYGYESAAPNLIGDFFGGGSQRVLITNTVPFSLHVRGTITSGLPGSPTATLIFENANSLGPANDFATNGVGTDASGDGQADTFPITEPIPPNDSPTTPGTGFVFDGGTVVYTDSNGLTTAQNGTFGNGELWFAEYSFSETTHVDVPGGGGSVVRRIKLGENNSPDPRDRIYWNFNHFNNVPNGFGDVNRYVFGFEKTFRDRGMSFDVRLPFASTLASEQIAEGAGSKDIEFGNATITWKTLLYETDELLISGGFGVGVPTADDTRLYRLDGRQILQIDNAAVHLLPYVAMSATPRENWFVQGFLQFDIDANGNPIAGDVTGVSIERIGKLHDATYLFLDGSIGYWLYRNPYGRTLTGVTPVIELHYSTTLQDADAATGNGLTVQGVSQRFDVLNMTLGTHLLLGQQLVVTPAIGLPLRSGDDQQFDIEAMVLANWNF
ncbi:MAG: hypothetical protein AB7F89_14655 [Pirellulaceae bacterium]